MAAPGSVLLSCDFAAIEAVLVGYFANSPRYVRLAKLGVHDFFNSYVLRDQGKIDHPAVVEWSDADLKAFFADLKKRFYKERAGSKQCVYLSAYGGTPREMYRKHPELFDSEAHARRLRELYFALFPDILVWQRHTIEEAHDTGYLRAPFGHIHRFWRVKEWTKRNGEWEARDGDDANAALAFKPQNTAARITNEAILRMHDETLAGGRMSRFLRLQVHDDLTSEVPEPLLEAYGRRKIEIMTAPVPVLELPWAPGEHLSIGVEAKVGHRWSDMCGWQPQEEQSHVSSH